MMAAPVGRPQAAAKSHRQAAQKAEPAAVRQLEITRGVSTAAEKVVIYGPGGVGKSTLCSLLGDTGIDALFVDPEESTKKLDVARVIPQNWNELRSVLQNREYWEPFGAVVLESATKAEEMAVAWTIENVPKDTEKGPPVFVRSIEGYGWGKGYTHVYETYLCLLGDLDAIARSGRHVIVTAHNCAQSVPNPAGENYLQYQPRLQQNEKGRIRERVKEWTDHLLYVDFDRLVEGNRAEGSGTRSIICSELAHVWAKTRSLPPSIPYNFGDATLWNLLFGKE